MTLPERIKFLTVALAHALVLAPALALAAGPDPKIQDPPEPLVRHELVVRLDPAAGTLDASDRLTLPPGPGPWTLTLHQGLDPRVTAGEATLEPLGRDQAPGTLPAAPHRIWTRHLELRRDHPP